MRDVQIQSIAFRNAELQSERLRIFGVLGFIAAYMAVSLVRAFVIRSVKPATPWTWSLVLAVMIIIYEFWTLGRVNSALKASRSLPGRFWILSTIVETSIPACVIAFLTSSQVEIVYRPLVGPSVLVFFVFIILSTLRLSPWISIFSGIVASVSYLCAALYLGWRPPAPGMPAPFTQSAVSLNAVTLLAGGVIASAVAGQIRKHVQAALREAETKSKLAAVQHDLQIARSIQQSLLPQEKPQIAGFDIAGWNRPADDTGGDYFDWKILPDGTVVVSLADVTGHGIGPALLAAVCHAYARASFGNARDLPTALECINRDLGTDLSTGRFVTFAAVMCRAGCSDVELLSAGHGPIFLYSHPDDRFTEINAQAVPFGILPSFVTDPPARLQLHSGDLLLLATDGFFEWENDQGEQFGTQRTEEVLRASRHQPASEIIVHLYEAVVRFSGGTKQQDDLTAVVIKFDPAGLAA